MTTNRYNSPEQGSDNWHQPLNENFERLGTDVEIRGTDAERDSYDPVDGAKYLATDTGTVYVGDGEAWNRLGTLGDSSAGGDSKVPKATRTARTNVGAMVGGTYHDNAYTDGGFGVVFEAADLYIDSVIVDADLSSISNPELTVELRKHESGATDPTLLDSKTVSLSGGAERISLGFQTPASGSADADANDEYVLQRGPAAGDTIPLRRRFEREDDWSEAAYTSQASTSPDIDFIKGSLNATSSGSDPAGSWYYFFDWLVGPETEQLRTPFSTDIDEIYVRSFDPESEFDSISPRALWIDTS